MTLKETVRHGEVLLVDQVPCLFADLLADMGTDDVVGESQPTARDNQHQDCGGHLLTDHPLWQLTDVFAATIPGVEFKPGVHVNYAETVLPMKDGLPKLKDFPKELGGTGQAVPE